VLQQYKLLFLVSGEPCARTPFYRSRFLPGTCARAHPTVSVPTGNRLVASSSESVVSPPAILLDASKSAWPRASMMLFAVSCGAVTLGASKSYP
jgi:hypothetical protein